jgi:hypothetical protein
MFLLNHKEQTGAATSDLVLGADEFADVAVRGQI